MQITKKELMELGACKGVLDRFIEQTGNTEMLVNVASLVGGLNNYSDLLWLASKTLTKDRIVRFACDCALINIELIKNYTDKYNEIVQFLKEPSSTAAYACAAAAAAVYARATRASDAAADTYAYACAAAAAARAAADAADAADAAADTYAYACADAARAARATAAAAYAYACAAAARAAARADAGNNKSVNKLLIEMFNEAD